MYRIAFFLLCGLIAATGLQAQSVGINSSGASPDASAMLDVQSTTQGMLVPRMDSSQRKAISNAATGLLVFDNSTNSFWFYEGSGWTELVSKGKAAPRIADADGNTQVQVEESPDDNSIRFDVAGSEAMLLDSTGNLIVKGSEPDDAGFFSLYNGDSTQFLRFFGGRLNDPSPFFNWGVGSSLRFVTTDFSFSTFIELMRINEDGYLGLGTISPSARFHVSEGSVLLEGTFDPVYAGPLPDSGAGTRLMWIPEIAAFRAGYVNGTQWNRDAIGDYSAVVGGENNTASGTRSFVGGGVRDTASGFYSFVGGGVRNVASGGYSFVGGGSDNTASGTRSFVGGGFRDTASGFYSFVGGGLDNTASGDYSFVGGGVRNSAASPRSFVAGGFDNTASGSVSFVGGGVRDTASGFYSFVGGGEDNTASGLRSFVAGGFDNTASGSASFVGGGWYNTASDSGSFVGGGFSNNASGPRSFVGGGQSNSTSGEFSFVGGGSDNFASNTRAFVGGGFRDTASGSRSFVGGGENNTASSFNSFVGGGESNQASSSNTFVGGGVFNSSSGTRAFIGGGSSNAATGVNAFVGGGLLNTSSGVCSFTGGGSGNTSSGRFSFVGGGEGLFAPSYGEAVFGTYAETYTPNNTLVFDGNDRLFVVGNGTSTTNRSNAVTVLKNGNVGIGNSNPSSAKLVVEGVGSTAAFFNTGYDYAISGPDSITTSFSAAPSGWFSGFVVSTGFIAFSDRRIKDIIGISNHQQDLQTLMGIEITDYRMKDTLAQGNRPYKKVIAQQVAEVYPQAVTANLTDVVPDIYQRAELQDGWIMLATDLQVGERVKLITEQSSEVYEVTDVEANRFQVSGLASRSETISPLASQIFVYGREVDDFHTVDYEAISMLNVSATQEQQRIIEAQQQRIEELEERIDQIEALEARLLQLEAALPASR